MKKAKIGDRILFKENRIGTVEVVYENSVIVIIENGNQSSLLPDKTVVNHKRYQILS